MWFSYDSVGNPVAVMYNGVEYYYVKNLQGDIIGLVDGSGAWVVRYRYDAWGRVLSITGNLAATLGQDNPLRYRGYFYDVETGFYYVSSRYYDPQLCRFISADTTDILEVQNDLYDKNLYSYCDNNPVMRKDSNGELWFVSIGAGLATQYVGDIIANIAGGATGAAIFSFRSSAGEYVAAGVTALIPGTGLGGSLVRNIVAEGIVSIERHITGEENSLQSSVKKVLIGTAIDTGVEAVSNNITGNITTRTSKTYSQYAKTAYRRNPNATVDNIRKSAQRSVRWGNRLAKAVDFIINSFRSALSW